VILSLITSMLTKSFLRLLAMPILFAGAAFTQTLTWQGLRFGMSHQETKRTLHAKGFEMEPSDTPEKISVRPDFELSKSVFKFAFSFTPEVYFEKDKLVGVNLSLDQPKTMAVWQLTPPKDTIVLVSAAAHVVYEQLLAKYGKPLEIKGDGCENSEPADLLHQYRLCDARWKSGSQLIKFFWTFEHDTDTLTFLIMYRDAVSSEL